VSRDLTADELSELLGAYALDALDGAEQEQIERWLERSPRARAELAELRETASLLAHAGSEAPPGLWNRIEESLAVEPPRLVVPLDAGRRSSERRRRLTTRISAAVAATGVAAAAITVFVLSDEMSDQEQRLEEVARSVERDGMREAALAAAADPRSRRVRLASSDGEWTATVVTLPDGRGYLMRHNLPMLAPGRTYQLWAMTRDAEGSDAISAGVLGRTPGIVAFHAPESVVAFKMTDEPAPGAQSSTAPAVVFGDLRET
jgi:Anti-sigma-K factor rskA